MTNSAITPPEPTRTEITWQPDSEVTTRLDAFIADAAQAGHVAPNANYRELWTWSVTELSEFWELLASHFDVIGEGLDGPALMIERMPGAVWYPNARLNLAENVLRPAFDPERMHETAIIDITEANELHSISWRELANWVSRTAALFRELGVTAGDRVAAVLPNTPEAIVGLLAAASIGAVWSICSPDLAPDVVVSRFNQLEPKLLISNPGYQFNGKYFDRVEYTKELARRLSSVSAVVLTGDASAADEPAAGTASALGATIAAATHPFPPQAPIPGGTLTEPAHTKSTLNELTFARLPFDHPLWVLFSSGTTGTPKGIVHGHGGILLESLKNSGLAHDMGPGDIYYVAANTSWMVWNTLVSHLATGSSVVTYSGSPTYGSPTRQFEVIERCGATMFGVGAAYLTLVEKSGAVPREQFDLGSLRNILSTGSPLPPSTWRWVHEAIGEKIHLGSDSGGTDICSGIVGSNFISPVYLGECQGPLLGVAAAAWNDRGEPVIGELGELVITRPMPSMPLFLWDDESGERYLDSYFAKFSGVWAQGDWVTESQHHGFEVHGRSDATLNRQGVRLGTGDIYATLQELDEVVDSLVLGVEGKNGSYWMPLFVALRDGLELDDALRQKIMSAIRSKASPRHVPDEIMQVPDIPLTHAGKRIEVPLKSLFSGRPLDAEAVKGTLRNPESLDWFLNLFNAVRNH